MPPNWKIKKDILDVGRRLHNAGLVFATDGNISYRLSETRILITGAGTALGELSFEDIITVDLDGNVVSGTRKASSETPMHLAVYTKRPDARAVVHAHPPTATGFTIAGIPLTDNVIPEIILTLGNIPTAPYVTPSSDEGPRAVAENIAENDAILLDHHGALTVGETLIQAYFRMEKVEYAAKVLLTAYQLGKVTALTPEQLEKLQTISVYGKKYKGD